MLVKVTEIHNSEVDKDEFDIGDTYSTKEASIVNIYSKEPNIISFDIEIGSMDKLAFVKEMSNDFSNAFIIMAPNDNQDIIIDFTLKTDKYFEIIDTVHTVE